MEGSVPFHQLPVVVLTKIMSYLPIRDKMVTLNVCCDWADVIGSISSVWKYVSIGYISIFHGDWRKANTVHWLTPNRTREMNEYEIKTMDKFLTELAEATDSIQHFKLDIPFKLREATLVRLLTKQKKLISLSLCSASGWKADSEMCYNEEFNAGLFEIIHIHQNTLEYLDLSIPGISFEQCHKYLEAADFPNLQKISYPVKFSNETPYFKSYTSDDKEALVECFMQTLKHGKVEEINMDLLDEEAFLLLWDAVMANSLKKQILQGKTKHLKKIPLDSIFVNERLHDRIDYHNLENITNDIETLMRQCPELTHLKCHFSRGTIPSKQFGKLVRHYSNQIIYIQCEATNTIAELISNSCINLTALVVSEHNELTGKGLLAFCKLFKLEYLHLKLENKDSITGLITLLSSCMCNLKQLSLELSWNFYNENKLYSVISQNSSVLQSLSFSTTKKHITREEFPHFGINCKTFIEGFLKIICTCSPLKCLSLDMFNFSEDIGWEEETANNLFQCIMKYHPMLNTLTFYIEGMSPSQSLMKHVINCMPYCQIKRYNITNNYPQLI